MSDEKYAYCFFWKLGAKDYNDLHFILWCYKNIWNKIKHINLFFLRKYTNKLWNRHPWRSLSEKKVRPTRVVFNHVKSNKKDSEKQHWKIEVIIRFPCIFQILGSYNTLHFWDFCLLLDLKARTEVKLSFFFKKKYWFRKRA